MQVGQVLSSIVSRNPHNPGLSSTQRSTLESILSQYDPKNFSASDTTSLRDQLRAAGVPRNAQVRQILENKGFGQFVSQSTADDAAHSRRPPPPPPPGGPGGPGGPGRGPGGPGGPGGPPPKDKKASGTDDDEDTVVYDWYAENVELSDSVSEFLEKYNETDAEKKNRSTSALSNYTVGSIIDQFA